MAHSNLADEEFYKETTTCPICEQEIARVNTFTGRVLERTPCDHKDLLEAHEALRHWDGKSPLKLTLNMMDWPDFFSSVDMKEVLKIEEA